MKIVLSVLAFTALGLASADAAMLDLVGAFNHLVGAFNPAALLGSVGNGQKLPAQAIWGLMIFSFTLLARLLRRKRRAKL
jgi:hypothetical protein